MRKSFLKNKLTKVLPIASIVLLSSVLPFNSASAAITATTTSKPYIEQKISSWNESKESYKLVNSAEGKVNGGVTVLHNGGKPITNNIITAQPKEETVEPYVPANPDKSNLVAVIAYNLNGDNYRNYFFTNQSSESLTNIIADAVQTSAEVALAKRSLPYQTTAVKKGNNYYNTYSWKFYNSNGRLGAKLTTNLEMKRKSTNTKVNGRAASVWDVKAISQIENKIINPPFRSWTTRLAVPYSAEKLIDEGPSTKTSTSVGVSLSGFVPSISWSWNQGSFNVYNKSSLSSKYGRWTMKPDLTNPQPMKAKMTPGIRATNNSGNFAVQLSHQYERSRQTHNSGTVSAVVPDR